MRILEIGPPLKSKSNINESNINESNINESNINESNINEYNNDIVGRKNIIAKFHSPSCPACKAMENSWFELPKVIKKMGYNAETYNIANINVNKLNNKIHGWRNIRYVPTIANINGNKAKIYNGDTDTVSIAKFIIKEYKIPKLRNRTPYGGKNITKKRTKERTKERIKERTKERTKAKKKKKVSKKK